MRATLIFLVFYDPKCGDDQNYSGLIIFTVNRKDIAKTNNKKSYNHRLVSSVGRAPNFCAGSGLGCESRPDQHSGS